MTPRIKKLIGLIILLPALAAYLLAAALLGAQVPSFWLFQVIFYAAAGVAWAFPMIFLMRWMNAEPSRDETP